MILIAVILLCIGSLVHNELYFRGRFGGNLLSGIGFVVRRKAELDEPIMFGNSILILAFIVLAPVGLIFLWCEHFGSNRMSWRRWRQILLRGWRDLKHDRRKWRYRVKNGKRSQERLARMKARKE
jgi:hypothetical protein